MHVFSKNLWSLYGSRLLMHSGLNLIGVFLPVFLYIEFSQALFPVLAAFAYAFALHALLIPLAARYLKHVGMKKMMIVAIVPFLLLSLVALALWDFMPTLMLFVYLTAWAIYRALYWVPYHVEVSSFLDTEHRGRQVSFFANMVAVLSVATPFIGGLMIAFLGFQWLFIAGILFVVLAVFPLLCMHETHEEYSYGYMETYQQLFKKENRGMVFAYMGDGAQTIVAVVFWPIFIYLILNGSFAAMGALSALVVLATIILTAFAGELVDKISKTQLILISTVIYTTGWFLKSLATTAIHIFLFDAYHNAGKAVNRVAFDAGSYTHLAEHGHYVDELTALKEIALNAGRVLMLLLGGLFAALFGIKVAFVLAAFASLGMVMVNSALKHDHTR